MITTSDLRTRAEQHLQDGEGDDILLIAQLLAALAAAEQREQALRDEYEGGWTREQAQAQVRDFNGLCACIRDLREQLAEAERRAFGMGWFLRTTEVAADDTFSTKRPLTEAEGWAAYQQQARQG